MVAGVKITERGSAKEDVGSCNSLLVFQEDFHQQLTDMTIMHTVMHTCFTDFQLSNDGLFMCRNMLESTCPHKKDPPPVDHQMSHSYIALTASHFRVLGDLNAKLYHLRSSLSTPWLEVSTDHFIGICGCALSSHSKQGPLGAPKNTFYRKV